MQIVGYYGTGNLGDVMQTLALSRWLPPCRPVFRSAMGRANGRVIVSGWLKSEPLPPPECAVFIGVHPTVPRLFLDYGYTGTIGTRDAASAQALNDLGISAEVVGCATLTLPRYTGPRESYSVSVDSPVEADVKVSHGIPGDMPWPEQWQRALKYLDIYRRARLVYTTRLHVILPCVALGTPVIYTADSRFSVLGERGLNKTVDFDPAPLRAKFLAFLVQAIGQPLVEHDPIYPDPSPAKAER